jgi:RNA-directed DNA polymerase
LPKHKANDQLHISRLTLEHSKSSTKGDITIKRYGNLYSKVISKENLINAANKAKKNKNKMEEINYFRENQTDLIDKLHNELKHKTFTTSDYRTFNITDRGKSRVIHDLPFYPDRIVHWAIMLQIEDILLKVFIKDTYAAIPKRGGQLLLTRMRKELIENKEECTYYLQIDIKKFFPSIDRDILSKLMRKKFKDRDLLWLIDDIIYSLDEGIPIGNYTSQYLGNFYLAYFDHYCKEELGLKRYYRYMDDIVVVHKSKSHLRNCFSRMRAYINRKLNLRVKGNWHISPTFTRGIDFIGYRNFGKYVLLRKSTAKRLKSKMRHLMRKDKLSYKDKCSFNSYMGWVKWCSSYNLFNSYMRPVHIRLKEGII